MEKRSPKIGWYYNSWALFVVPVNGAVEESTMLSWSKFLIKIIIIDDRQIAQVLKCLLCKQ